MIPLHARLLVAACAGLLATGCERQVPPATGAPPPAVEERSVVLAEVPEAAGPPADAAPPGIGLHTASAVGSQGFVFAERGGGVGFVVEADGKFQVIHNGRAGRPYAAVGALVLSPDGRRHAYGALVEGRWRMVVDGKEGAPFSAVDDPVFSPDGAHLAYQGMRGERWHLVVDGRTNAGTRTHYLAHELAGDSSRLAYVEDADDADGADRGRLVITDLAFRVLAVVDAGVTSLERSPDGRWLVAVSETGGKQEVLTLPFARPDQPRRERAYERVTGLAFASDRGTVAFLGERAGRTMVVLGGREQPLPPGAAVVSPLVVRPGEDTVGALVAADGAVRYQEFFAGGWPGAQGYVEAEGPALGPVGGLHAYAARRGWAWHLVVNGREGPPFERIVSPRVSPDGQRIVYRARQAGRRFVVVAGLDAQTVRRYPDHDQVFPVRFTADGKAVAYGVKDGPVLAWQVEPL